MYAWLWETVQLPDYECSEIVKHLQNLLLGQQALLLADEMPVTVYCILGAFGD